MDFQNIDIVMIGITLFLAIRGLVNGFSKELFNFLGLIGAVFVASRFNDIVGKLIIEQNVLPPSMEQYQKVIGFIAVFVGIWIIFNIISSIFSSSSPSEEKGIISRILGYAIAIVRYIAIISIIIYGFNNSDFFKEKFSKYTEESKLFEPISNIGAIILNRENNRTSIDNNSKVDINSTKENNISKID